MRTIGHRKERPNIFSASAPLLLEGARFQRRDPSLADRPFDLYPKGVFRFKSHEAANQHQQACLIDVMVEIALKRS